MGDMVNDGVKNSRLFIAGVLQWIGDSPPGAEHLSQIKLDRYVALCFSDGAVLTIYKTIGNKNA
jgi:hypothetical protein